MTHINRTALVAYSAEKMFELVNDIEAYPTFLPWCSGSTVSERSSAHLLASITINKGPVKTTFSTSNTLQPPCSVTGSVLSGDIQIRLVDGPFKHLAGCWRFHVLSPDACKVEMDMDFDFAGGPVGLLLKPVFTHICNTLLNAFVERATVVYAN